MNHKFVKQSLATVLGFVLCLTTVVSNAAPNGWFIRLTAEAPAEKLSDPGNVLGLLNDSANTYDSHDLIEIPPFGTPYLTLVFPHPNWGAKAGDYTTDFQKQDRRPHTWTFELRSDKTARNVTLRWEGDAAKLKKSILKDVKTGKIYSIRTLQHLTFTVGATKRLFVWTVAP
jgi:hypothetical protein